MCSLLLHPQYRLLQNFILIFTPFYFSFFIEFLWVFLEDVDDLFDTEAFDTLMLDIIDCPAIISLLLLFFRLFWLDCSEPEDFPFIDFFEFISYFLANYISNISTDFMFLFMLFLDASPEPCLFKSAITLCGLCVCNY